MTTAKLDEMIPMDEAAAELHTTRLRLLMLVKGGTLAGEEAGGVWQISRSTLDELKARGGVASLMLDCKSHCSSSSCSCK